MIPHLGTCRTKLSWRCGAAMIMVAAIFRAALADESPRDSAPTYNGVPISTWRSLLGDRESTTRSQALRAFRAFGAPGREVLLAALTDEDEWVRANAAAALGAAGQDAAEAVPALMKLLNEPSSAAPQSSERATHGGLPLSSWKQRAKDLDRRTSREAMQILRRAEGDPRPRCRAAAIDALAAIRVPSDKLLAGLISALGDMDPSVRNTAARALGSMGESAAPALGSLIDNLADEDEPVLRGAGRSMSLEHRSAPLEAIEKIGATAVPQLTTALAHENPRVSDRAAQLLDRMGPTVHSKLIETAKAGGNATRTAVLSSLRKLGVASNQALPLLLAALKDEDPGVRAAAASTLGAYGIAARKAMPALIALRKDSSELVRQNAEKAIVTIRDEIRAQ